MLEFQNFSKIYKGGHRAVDGLTLRVAPGELCAFIGHNGAGKTTSLKAAAGILDFEEGDILVGGVSVKADPLACKRQLAYIPDEPRLYPNLTGLQYLSFIGDIYGVSAAERRARIEQYAGAFELTGNLGDLIATYSHGMKQKLALVSAFLHQPRLLLLDEPFVGLDPTAALTLRGFMRELCGAGGAIFFSTHVLETAEKLCDRVAIIRRGKLAAAGGMDEVRRNESLESVFVELMEDV